MISALVFLSASAFVVFMIYVVRRLDYANEIEMRERQLLEEQRRIREITDKILAERRSKQDAEKRLDSGSF